MDLTDLAEAEKKLRKLRENKDVATDLDLAEQLRATRDKKPKKEDSDEGGDDGESKGKGKGKDADAESEDESFDEEDEDA